MANLFLMQPHIVWLAIKKVKEKREEGVTGKIERERERERKRGETNREQCLYL